MSDHYIAGFHSGHDCAFAVLKNGRPLVHAELERYLRLKEPLGDSLELLFEKYENYKSINNFSTGIDRWGGGPDKRYPETWAKMLEIAKQNNGDINFIGHHQSHAANAFFSSNFDEALIITIDGGGEEKDIDGSGRVVVGNFTVWVGEGNKIRKIDVLSDDGVNQSTNIGGFWSKCTEDIFGLSAGYPKGHQAGSVMAMACMGNPKKYLNDFLNHLQTWNHSHSFDYAKYKKIADISESSSFDVAAALQRATEIRIKELLQKYIKLTNKRNICLSGGVTLNCVMAGKIFDWFSEEIDNIYADPVPYDAGIALGSARYLWHHILGNERIKWVDNSKSYLGFPCKNELVEKTLQQYKDKITVKKATDDEVLDLLIDKKIVSVFGGPSESGRRALGNRSILADPRHEETKDIVNQRVKHRQWYRPFAPSILREEVPNWFVKDICSPYMSFAIHFKEEQAKKVPAVAHFDNTARLQTVTENDNSWYYNFIKKFKDKTGVPILLNTSFNDREPIVELPEHAINCFLGTQIDYLYFYECGLLVKRK